MEPSDRPTRPAEPPARDESLVELGPIVNRHGIRGELRLLLHNPESDAVVASAEVVVLWPGGRREARRVRGSPPPQALRAVAARRRRRRHRRRDARSAAPWPCRARRCRRPGSDAVYHADLLGCAVVTTAGEALGTVREMLVTGSNDVCVVRDATREVLVPMVADVIEEIDLAGRRLVVRPLPGLLDDGE